jgi:uncharacterized protein (TIGR02217 family)
VAYLVGVRLNENIERGALGGARFNTSVLELDSGFEKRNINWSVPRAEFDIGFGLLLKYQLDPASTQLDLDELINFFYIVQGKANSFRMKDWSDFEIGYQNGSTAGVSRQFLGLGDDVTTDFQIFKRYSFGGQTYDRIGLTKMVDNAKVELALDGVLQTNPADYTIDADRGLFKMVTAPASTGGTGPGGAELLEFRCEFDLHGRLDTDDLKVNMEIFNAGSWPNIPWVELRGNGID